MKFGRSLVLVAVAFVVAGLSGMATLIVRAESPRTPAAPIKPAEAQAFPVKPIQVPNCNDQDDDDDDDDRDEVKNGKPDTDDIELQCGDQDDDDGEIEDDDAPGKGKGHEREKHEVHHTQIAKKTNGK